MMKLLFFVLMMTSFTIAQKWIPVDFNHPAVRIEGRYSINGDELLAAWSGTSFTIAFEGTALKVNMKSPGNVFNVFLDNDSVPKILDLSQNNHSEHLILKDLPPGVHVVTLYKRTEAHYGEVHFKGFEILGIPLPTKLPRKKMRKIEFIGNSITCGYGILDSIKENGFNILTEDSYYSYASVAARALHAETHLICASGHGFFRNYDGNQKETIPFFYERVSPFSEKSWNFSNWIPNAVVINLGTNDFATGIPDSVSFTHATVSLIKKVRSYYPKTPIILVDGPMLSDFHPPASEALFKSMPKGYLQKNDNGYTFRSLTVCRRFLDSIQEQLKISGDSLIYRFSFAPQDGTLGYGADWHPSLKQAFYNGKEFAQWVYKALKWYSR